MCRTERASHQLNRLLLSPGFSIGLYSRLLEGNPEESGGILSLAPAAEGVSVEQAVPVIWGDS